jgi:hypothetical protein
MQEEDQVQDEGEDRYLIFGNLYLAVAPFLNNSNKINGSILSGRTEPLRYAPQKNKQPALVVTQTPQLTRHFSVNRFFSTRLFDKLE